VDQQVIPHSLIDFKNDGSGDTVKYQPSTPFPDNCQVDIYFKVVDFANNWADTSYWFNTELIQSRERIAPIIEVIRPKPDTTNVPVTSDIVLYITDNISGVDTSTVELNVDNQTIFHFDLDFINNGIGDTIRYIPVTPFAYNAQVDVYFKVADFDSNYADTSYCFWTETQATPDTIPPVIKIIRPQPDEKDVLTTTDIVLYLIDDVTGVDTSTIELRINKQLIQHRSITVYNDGSGDSVRYIPLKAFQNNSKVEVYFKVADFALNWADTSYSFETRGAKLIAPNIFTPNDDGYNDDAEFDFEQFDVEDPNLKIFDMHGKKIKEFDIPTDKKFFWNGSDNSGRPLLPGVYLYIFSDKNKAIARGAIVIAR